MQNRSHPLAPITVLPMELDPAFPFRVIEHSFRHRRIAWLHVHNVLEIGLCRRGRSRFRVEDKEFPFEPGDVMVVNQWECHHAWSPSGQLCEASFLFADVSALLVGAVRDAGLLNTRRLGGRLFSNHVSPRRSPIVCDFVADMIEESRRKRPHWQDCVRAMLCRVLVELSRMQEHRAEHPTTSRHNRPDRSYDLLLAVQPALEWIAQRYDGKLTVVELAQRCAMSVSHFRRLFTRLMGCSPLDYIHEYRVSLACSQLATTQRPISDVAGAVGYESWSSFNRAFRQRRGCTPTEWRQRAEPDRLD